MGLRSTHAVDISVSITMNIPPCTYLFVDRGWPRRRVGGTEDDRIALYAKLSTLRARLWVFVVVCSSLFTGSRTYPFLQTPAPHFLIGKTEKFLGARKSLWCFVLLCLQERHQMVKKDEQPNETVSVSVRLSKDLIRWIQERATQERRTKGGFIRNVLEDLRAKRK